jgi:hypothetical protein
MGREKGHCNERGSEAPKPGTERGPRRVRMCVYSVRRNLGLLLDSLAGGRALSVHGGHARSAVIVNSITRRHPAMIPLLVLPIAKQGIRHQIIRSMSWFQGIHRLEDQNRP